MPKVYVLGSSVNVFETLAGPFDVQGPLKLVEDSHDPTYAGLKPGALKAHCNYFVIDSRHYLVTSFQTSFAI